MTGDPAQGIVRARSTLIALAVSLAMVTACVTVWTPPEPKGYHRTTTVAEGEAIGAEECVVCHENVLGYAPIPAYHEDCESCHGLGSIHAETEEPGDMRYPSSADCLGCHESGRTTHLAYATGDHERAGLICSDCHNVHNRAPRHVRQVKRVAFGHLDTDSTLCVQCHTDVASRLTFPSHHPVREGMLTCADCHPPHGDRRTTFGDRTRLCAGCHQDHAGPWIYEHTPVAEDCTLCHNPHGTASRNLLDTSEPALCLSCHTVPSFHSPDIAPARFYTRCTDCHGAIHGSYESSVFFE
jgi:DmsE family decaheme c-type cytochrome